MLGTYFAATLDLATALEPLFRMLISILLLLSAYGLARFGWSYWRETRRREALLRLGIEGVDGLTGRDFERLVTAVFSKRGYGVEMTPYVGDWGADVVVSKDGKRTVIQAKRHKGRVGVRAVQEVLGAKGKYKADEMLVVTNSTYTKHAIELARANGVELWARDDLVNELERLAQWKEK